MKKYLLFLSLFITTCVIGQQRFIDSLQAQLAVAPMDTSRVNLLAALAERYYLNKPDSALLLSQQGLELARNLNYSKGEAFCLLLIATRFRQTGNYIKEIELVQQALKISEDINDPKGVIQALNSYAMVFNYQGNHSKELSLYQQMIKQARKLKDTALLIRSLADAGNTCLTLKKIDSAAIYLKEAYQLIKAAQLNNGFSSYAFMQLGKLYAAKNDKKQALFYFYQAIPAWEEMDARGSLSRLHYYIADLYQKYRQTDSAFYYAKLSFSMAEKSTSYLSSITKPSLLLGRLYEERNNPGEALRYYKIATAASDSLMSKEKMNQLFNLVFNEQLQKQELAAAKQQHRSEMKLYALLVITGVFLILAFVLFRNNKQKQKANALLQQQKEKTDVQKAKVEEALQELKATQTQLVQKEKMASLGELTAGIAHEIQNPLNFMKNFSEVNNDLMDEMLESIDKGNIQEIRAIAFDIRENNAKINHHGKRADAIIKGMLQHSRMRTGQKEPTDINALADEYLRLSYEGMRAVYKNFTIVPETSFDSSIGKVNAVPQDIGRVLLNLFNNAYYSVNEKKKLLNGTYKPAVSVNTRKINDAVVITVRDNGTGIPQKVIDKIYQPFFTTKPTGEGTGLGLSLSYDIITKGHGGELKVNTKEGEFAEFIVILPV